MSCTRHLREGTEQTCHGLRTTPVDDLVARQVLRALEPAALELSLQAARDVRQERDRLHRHREQQLERARYESERAERQYHAVEPDYAQFRIMRSPCGRCLDTRRIVDIELQRKLTWSA